MPDPQEQLSGAQLATVNRMHLETVNRLMREIELRKYVLDQSCLLLGKTDGAFTPAQAIDLAKAMFEFVTEGVKAPADGPGQG